PGYNPQCTIDARFDRYALNDSAGNISVRRLPDGNEIARLPGFGWHVVAWSLSSQGRFLAVEYDGRNANRVQVWDVGRQRVTLNITNPVSEVPFDFNLDETLIAVGDSTHTITLYDLPSGELRKRLTIGKPPWALRFNPDGDSLAVGLEGAAD